MLAGYLWQHIVKNTKEEPRKEVLLLPLAEAILPLHIIASKSMSDHDVENPSFCYSFPLNNKDVRHHLIWLQLQLLLQCHFSRLFPKPSLEEVIEYSPGSPPAHPSVSSTTVICSCDFTLSNAEGFFSSIPFIPTPRLKGNDSLPTQKAITQESTISKQVMMWTSQIVCSEGKDRAFSTCSWHFLPLRVGTSWKSLTTSMTSWTTAKLILVF